MSRRYSSLYLVIAVLALSVLTGSKRPLLTRITINSADSIVYTWGATPKSGFKTNDGLTYFWFTNNQIFHTDGGYSGKLLHGDYLSKYPNGQMKISGQFSFGVKNGEWKQWYEDGRLKETAEYSDGKLHGKHVVHNNNKLTHTSYYKHGAVKRNRKQSKKGNDTLSIKQSSNRKLHVKNTDSIDKRSKSKTSLDSNKSKKSNNDSASVLKTQQKRNKTDSKDSVKPRKRSAPKNSEKADSIRRK
jgi:hypothetical protein